jgi:hypothetical protein
VFRPRHLIAKIDTNNRGFHRDKHLRWRVRTTKFDRFLIDAAPREGRWYDPLVGSRGRRTTATAVTR